MAKQDKAPKAPEKSKATPAPRKKKQPAPHTPTPVTEQTSASTIRLFVRSLYRVQKIRIQIGNQICGHFNTKINTLSLATEEEPKEQKILKQLRLEHKKITEGILAMPRSSNLKQATGIMSDEAEFAMVDLYQRIEGEEKAFFRQLESILQAYPLYTDYLTHIRGVGSAISAIILSEFDIHKCQYPSSMWKYAGLDVASDGKGRSRRKEHLHEVAYTNKDGEEATKNVITFNPFLKTKLIDVLGGSLLKGRNEYYKSIYDNYKTRLLNHPDHAEKRPAHIHAMATRYMVKIFLVWLHIVWRRLEGLPVHKPYHADKLGRDDHWSDMPEEAKPILLGKDEAA